MLLASLEGLAELQRPGLRILDLGCGVGVLGLSLKKASPRADLLLTDRDALALAFAGLNARANGLEGVALEGRLGPGPVPQEPLHLVVANLPAKAGAPVLEALVRDSLLSLEAGGLFAIVIVRPLETMARDALQRNGAVIEVERPAGAHTVFHARSAGPKRSAGPEGSAGPERPSGPEGPSGPQGSSDDRLEPYLRGRFTFSLAGLDYDLATAWNLPDFDTPGYDLRLAARLLEEGAPAGPALCWNPGQGHLPVLLASRDPGRPLTLASRDLLQLRIAERNLRERGLADPRILHRPLFQDLEEPREQERYSLITVLPDVDPGVAWEEAILPACARLCADGGRVAIAASSTAVQRMLRSTRGFRLLRSHKTHGRRGVLLERLYSQRYSPST